jgi:hypothetical protein
MESLLTQHLRLAHLIRPALIGLIAGASVCAGVVPNLQAASPQHWFDQAAYAQNPPSASEITNYAKAVLQMEPHRRQAVDQIRRAGGNTNIVCSSVFSGLPGGQVAANYCNRAARIVRDNGLSNRRFNEITQIATNDAGVQSRIQAQMAQLCSQPEYQAACR